MNEFLQELQNSARQVAEDAGVPAKEASTWPLVIELGWLLTAVPEELDGLGLGLDATCMLQQELGRALAEVPFLPASLAVDALCQSQLANKAELVAQFAMGDTATTSLVDSQVVGEPQGEAIALTGTLTAVQSADDASHLLVWTQGQDCLALIATDSTGVSVTARPTWDTTRRLFDVTLQGVKAEGAAILAKGEAAAVLIRRIETLRDFGLAADALGGAAALLDMTVEHLQTRVQFGRPLALFQALKHRCADMKTDIAAGEALLANCVAEAQAQLGEATAQLAAKKAKQFACQTYASVTEDALQLHGGIGMASEYPCHLFLKRSMLSENLGCGSGDYCRDVAEAFLQNQP